MDLCEQMNFKRRLIVYTELDRVRQIERTKKYDREKSEVMVNDSRTT